MDVVTKIAVLFEDVESQSKIGRVFPPAKHCREIGEAGVEIWSTFEDSQDFNLFAGLDATKERELQPESV